MANSEMENDSSQFELNTNHESGEPADKQEGQFNDSPSVNDKHVVHGENEENDEAQEVVEHEASGASFGGRRMQPMFKRETE